MLTDEEIKQNFLNSRENLYNRIIGSISKYVTSENFLFVPLSIVKNDGSLHSNDLFQEILIHDVLITSLTKKIVIFLDDSFGLTILSNLHDYLLNHVVDIRNIIVIHNSYGIVEAWQNYCELCHLESFSVCEFLVDSPTLAALVEPIKVSSAKPKDQFDYLAFTQLGSVSPEKIILKQILLELFPNNQVHVDMLQENGRYTEQEVIFQIDQLFFFQDAKIADKISNKIVYPTEIIENPATVRHRRTVTTFYKDLQIASRSLVSLCRETYNPTAIPYPRITEKTVKSVLNMQPILYFCCPPGNHAVLNTLGIQNNYNFFDYSFDSDKYIWDRNLLCLQNLKQFSDLTTDDYVDIHKSIYSQLKFNFEMVTSGKLLDNIFCEFEKSFALAIDRQTTRIQKTNNVLKTSFNNGP